MPIERASNPPEPRDGRVIGQDSRCSFYCPASSGTGRLLIYLGGTAGLYGVDSGIYHTFHVRLALLDSAIQNTEEEQEMASLLPVARNY